MKDEIIEKVKIRSKYLNLEDQRHFIVSPKRAIIAISSVGDPSNYKQFDIEDVHHHEAIGKTLKIGLSNGRNYQIYTKNPQRLQQAINLSKSINTSNTFIQQKMSVSPKAMIYKNINNSKQMQPRTPTLVQRPIGLLNKEVRPNYQLQAGFYNSQDWKWDEKQKCLVLINEKLKGNNSKIIGFVLKKFITTGSFMGISFPVFAMKPQSILESYAKSLATAPKLFEKVYDSLERMKKFVCFLFTISILQTGMQKPFNPVIGETFQCIIAGGLYSSEQVCHHPPISSFFYQGKGYVIYGSLELSASISINSAQGRFLGDLAIRFEDGYEIKGKIPSGSISGLIIGSTTFQPKGGAYAYDNRNLVCTFTNSAANCFEGYLGELNQKYKIKFAKQLTDKQRFLDFQGYKRQKYDKVQSQMIGKWGEKMLFDGIQYLNFREEKYFPFVIEPFKGPLLLKSDSSFRKDIQLSKIQKLEESQAQKDRIEEEERQRTKIREKRMRK